MKNRLGQAFGAAALAAVLGLASAPVGAQQASPGTAAPTPKPDASAGAAVSDSALQRTGAALRDISGIQARYNQRMQGAPPAERPTIEQEANSAAEAALAARGLTVEEYNGVIRLAQADPALRERLVSAASDAR